MNSRADADNDGDAEHVHDERGECCECGGPHCCCECPAFVVEPIATCPHAFDQ